MEHASDAGPSKKPYAFATAAYNSMADCWEDERSILFAHVGYIIEWVRMEVSGSLRHSVIAREHPFLLSTICIQKSMPGRNSDELSKTSTRTLASTHQTSEPSVPSVTTVR